MAEAFNRYPTKENEHAKIDGPVAAIIAMAVALVADKPREFHD